MAPPIPTTVPASLTAGDTWQFALASTDYPPSDGWTLDVVFGGAMTLHTQAADVVADGGTFTVTVPAARTDALPAGSYRWFAYVTKTGERHTIASGVTDVAANPATAQGSDLQAQCERDLAAVDAALSGKVTDDVASYMIGGRQVITIPVADLERLRARLKRDVWKLRHPGQAFPAIRSQFA